MPAREIPTRGNVCKGCGSTLQNGSSVKCLSLHGGTILCMASHPLVPAAPSTSSLNTLHTPSFLPAALGFWVHASLDRCWPFANVFAHVQVQARPQGLRDPRAWLSCCGSGTVRCFDPRMMHVPSKKQSYNSQSWSLSCSLHVVRLDKSPGGPTFQVS